ncbi:hypothetical protein FISHEDRAFT_33850 [Fistulina hepatica ATCC 64428]|uniref:Uncharacterized protein n=1 Tax=Fistulina hepatica ATCC 64428 TaxID=1128425 RepID=A0A0D7AMW3_9AGAR|nr:hypothetical protein FISHEDRAFT_33850 [Fistulina hepatica ATCC 64428]
MKKNAAEIQPLPLQAERTNPPTLIASSSYVPRGSQTPPVYYYVDRETGMQIASLLPPDDPQSVCLQQGHVTSTKFGLLGLLAAVFWFPLGIALCFIDRRVQCVRCKATLRESPAACGSL